MLQTQPHRYKPPSPPHLHLSFPFHSPFPFSLKEVKAWDVGSAEDEDMEKQSCPTDRGEVTMEVSRRGSMD